MYIDLQKIKYLSNKKKNQSEWIDVACINWLEVNEYYMKKKNLWANDVVLSTTSKRFAFTDDLVRRSDDAHLWTTDEKPDTPFDDHIGQQKDFDAITENI